MIELCYHCPDCHTYLSGWFSAEDAIEQPEECLFCGGKQAFVYLSNVETETYIEVGSVEHTLLLVQYALSDEGEIPDILWEDPAIFEE